jgi:flagellar motor switch protein FliG
VLDRLANLEPGDEGAVLELESQLQRRVEQHRQRHERAAAATEMARRILVKTEPGQRDSLLARLSAREAPEANATRSKTATPESAASSQQAQDLAIAVRVARQPAEPAAFEGASHFEAWAGEPAGEAAKPQAASAAIALEDRSRELELLDDRSLLAALRLADERTVHCALAASSETFLKRVAGKLPRKQALRLREVVRSIGPTRLGELRWAQHELLRIARDCRAASAAA